MIKRVYTVKELAEDLSIGLNKAYDLVNDGDIRSVRVKSSIRIPVIEVERYLNNNHRVETHTFKNEIQTTKHPRFSQ